MSNAPFQSPLNRGTEIFPNTGSIVTKTANELRNGMTEDFAQKILAKADGQIRGFIQSQRQLAMNSGLYIFSHHAEVYNDGQWTVEVRYTTNGGQETVSTSVNGAVNKKAVEESEQPDMDIMTDGYLMFVSSQTNDPSFPIYGPAPVPYVFAVKGAGNLWYSWQDTLVDPMNPFSNILQYAAYPLPVYQIPYAKLGQPYNVGDIIAKALISGYGSQDFQIPWPHSWPYSYTQSSYQSFNDLAISWTTAHGSSIGFPTKYRFVNDFPPTSYLGTFVEENQAPIVTYNTLPVDCTSSITVNGNALFSNTPPMDGSDGNRPGSRNSLPITTIYVVMFGKESLKHFGFCNHFNPNKSLPRIQPPRKDKMLRANLFCARPSDDAFNDPYFDQDFFQRLNFPANWFGQRWSGVYIPNSLHIAYIDASRSKFLHFDAPNELKVNGHPPAPPSAYYEGPQPAYWQVWGEFWSQKDKRYVIKSEHFSSQSGKPDILTNDKPLYWHGVLDGSFPGQTDTMTFTLNPSLGDDSVDMTGVVAPDPTHETTSMQYDVTVL